MDVACHRGGLRRTRQALRDGRVTLGFVGGSITDPRPGWNWPEPVTAWFVETFPGVCVRVENAAIGATGSDLAVFRAERDLVGRECDLVFIEFAVNDDGEPAEKRMRTREGLIRKCLRDGHRDLVLAHTYRQSMYAAMVQGQVPASIAEFERLAEHYAIGSVWMGLHAFREVQQGRMGWDTWLPDGLHPQHRGSLSYGQSVIGFLEQELCASLPEAPAPACGVLPAPLNSRHWGEACLVPLTAVRREGPWVLQRWPKLAWIDQVLHTAVPGARLSFDFSGRGLALGFDFGRASAEFRFRLDGGPWQLSARDRPDWCGAEGWYRLFCVADDLPQGPHAFELEVVHGNPSGDPALAPRCTGTHFNLAMIGILP
jgi:hypothetical protein